MALETVDLNRFAKLFSSMERQLVMQSSFLESMYNISVEEREDSLSREQLLSVSRRQETPRYLEGPTREPSLKIPEDQSNSLFSGIFGPLVDMLPKIIAGISIAGIGSLLIRGGLITTLAPAIGTFIEKFVGQGLLDLGASADAANAFGSALGRAGTLGVIGSIFGKNTALLFGIAGGTSSIFETAIKDTFDANKDGIVEAFGLELSSTAVTGVGTAMGIGAAGILRYGPLQSKLLMGVSTLLAAYGDDAANWLETQTGIPADFTNVVATGLSAAAYGASLGSMFGPTGMIVGAIAGFAISMSAAFYDWLTQKAKDQREENLKQLEKDFEAAKAQEQQGEIDVANESYNAAAVTGIERIARGNTEPATLKLVEDSITAIGATDKERAAALTDTLTRAQNVGDMPQVTNPNIGGNLLTEKENLNKVLDAYLQGAGASLLDIGDTPVARNELRTIVPQSVIDVLGKDTVESVISSKLSGVPVPTPSTYPVATSMAKVDQLEQRAAQDKRRGTTMNSVSNPTYVGGATNVVNNNNNYNVLSSASQGLDHMVP